MPSTKRPFRVGRSRTGLGLFATEPIKKRTIIAEYRGRRLNTKQAEILEARGNRYLYEINSRWTIDGSSRKNLARYANHSCRPNSESDRLNGKVIIRAIKLIKPGAEITYDYGDDYFKNVITPPGCRCDKCREKRAKQQRERRAAAARREKREATKTLAITAGSSGKRKTKTARKTTASKASAKAKKKKPLARKAARR